MGGSDLKQNKTKNGKNGKYFNFLHNMKIVTFLPKI